MGLCPPASARVLRGRGDATNLACPRHRVRRRPRRRLERAGGDRLRPSLRRQRAKRAGGERLPFGQAPYRPSRSRSGAANGRASGRRPRQDGSPRLSSTTSAPPSRQCSFTTMPHPPKTSPPGGKGAKRAVALAPRLVPRGGDPSARWRAHARALRHRRERPRRARPRPGGARPQPDRRRGGPGDRQGGAHPRGKAGSAPPHRGPLLPRPAAPPRPPSQADARPPRRCADGGSARAPTRRRRCATTR